MEHDVDSTIKSDVNWPKIVFSEQFFNRVARIAERSIADPATAEQAVTFVIERLSENDWERCKKYTGKSSPETFVYSLSSNAVIDYARMIYGRERPPARIIKKGLTEIWKLLCMERQPVEVVVEKLCRAGQKSREMVNTMISSVRAEYPWCGFSSRPDSLDEGEGDYFERNELDNQLGSDDYEGAANSEEAIQFAHSMLDENVESFSGELASSARVIEAYGALEMGAQEVLILKLLYEKGMTGAAVARQLSLPKKEFDRLKKQILEKARTQLLSVGIEYGEA